MRISGAPVEVMTMSAPASISARREKSPAAPSKRSARARAASALRLTTEMLPTPDSARWRTAVSPIFPAPTTRTRRPESSPKIFRASSTAALLDETGYSPMLVSLRTLFAVLKAACRRWLSQGPTDRASTAAA